MTLGQLRTFLAVVNAGSIRAAARALVVSEPSVSAAVAALSRELGVPLTERVGRGIQLTESGQVFAGYAATLLGLADRATRAAREAADQPGRIRVAAVTTAGEYVLPPILADFLRLRPGLEVTIDVGNRASVLAQLQNKQADLALGGRPPDDGAVQGAIQGEIQGEIQEAVQGPIQGTAFRENLIVIVGRRGHPLASRPPFDPRRLSGETWLLREPGSGTRQTTEAFLAGNGVQPGSVMNVGSNGAIKRAAELGLGVTMISRDAVREELAGGQLALLPARGTPLRRSWYALFSTDVPLPASARLLLEFLRPSADQA